MHSGITLGPKLALKYKCITSIISHFMAPIIHWLIDLIHSSSVTTLLQTWWLWSGACPRNTGQEAEDVNHRLDVIQSITGHPKTKKVLVFRLLFSFFFPSLHILEQYEWGTLHLSVCHLFLTLQWPGYTQTTGLHQPSRCVHPTRFVSVLFICHLCSYKSLQRIELHNT